MPDTLHTKGRTLPPYLARIQAHNEAHMRWLLLGRMVKALLARWEARHEESHVCR